MKSRIMTPIALAAMAVSMLLFNFVTAPSILASTPKKPTSMFYVSLGDSYAAGPYASEVVTDVAPKHDLLLRNFACGGATTTSLMSVIGCSGGSGYMEVPYPTSTQLAAAISFIRAHHGRIGLITITIGGNDLGGNADNAPPIATNIASISAQLRAAAGKSVPILGLTYPDADIADWLNGPSGMTIAEESITAFQQVINPDWKAAYATANVTFVDITAASGAYIPLTELVNSPTYGEIPAAAAQICEWTLMCSEQNLHPSVVGNQLIAGQIARAYLKLQER